MRAIIVLLLATAALARRTGGGGSRGGYGGSSHSYPHSNGYSGTGRGHQSNTYSNIGVVHQSTQYNSGSNHYNPYGHSAGGGHNYPPSTGYSGNNHVPKQTLTHQNNVNHVQKTEVHNVHKTEVHHHHHYSPPQQIGYGSHHYPVYQGTPPVYVYQYRDSGSRFDTLLTGLALYNLGRMSAHHSSYNNYNGDRGYTPANGEVCKLGIRKESGYYEETRIDCQLMLSFILDSGTQTQVTDQRSSERNTITQTVTQTQTINNSTNGSSTTVTVTNTTVVDALQAKGESIRVTPGMKCVLIRTWGYSKKEHPIDCGLLQTYAQNSFRSASHISVASNFTLIVVMFIFQMFLF